MFNIGDKVRIIDNSFTSLPVGTEGEVRSDPTEADKEIYVVVFDAPGRRRIDQMMGFDEIELVEA